MCPKTSQTAAGQGSGRTPTPASGRRGPPYRAHASGRRGPPYRAHASGRRGPPYRAHASGRRGPPYRAPASGRRGPPYRAPASGRRGPPYRAHASGRRGPPYRAHASGRRGPPYRAHAREGCRTKVNLPSFRTPPPAVCPSGHGAPGGAAAPALRGVPDTRRRITWHRTVQMRYDGRAVSGPAWTAGTKGRLCAGGAGGVTNSPLPGSRCRPDGGVPP